MTTLDVTVDASAVTRMLDRIASNAGRRDLGFAAGRAAEQGARLISGVPRDTGKLAASIEGRGTWIVATATDDRGVRYGRFVFGGTKYMDARPPVVPGQAIARILADEIKRVLFR